jgi:hypothetical protein
MEEDDDLYGEMDLHAINDTIVKQIIENDNRIKEHYQKLQSQQKEIENQDKKLFSFVCDWQ